jgi:hypothetical protein
MKLLRFFAAALISAAALSAQANLIDLVGGEDHPVSPDNHFFFDPLVFPEYNIGGNLFAAEDINVTYSFLGSEAGWRNEFWVDGELVVSNRGPFGFVSSSVAAGEALDFYFRAIDYVGGEHLAVNGDNQDSSLPSFAIALDVTYQGIFYDAIIMMDDTGNQNDNDYDDLVIGIQVSRVPEPSTVLLIGLGLIGLVGARRLRS